MKKEALEIRTSKLAIVNEAVVANNLSEVDNLETFFESIIQELEYKIEDKKSYIATLKSDQTREVRDLKCEISDAEKFVAKAFVQVDSSKIKSYAEIKQEMPEYWERIYSSHRTLKALEEQLVEKTDSSKKAIAEHTLMLKQLEDYLTKIKR
jgi:hypothetical protein